MIDEEIPLDGGNATHGVVRVGDTVRKPWTEASPAVLEYMEALARQGIDLPRPQGRDAQGRMVTEFVPGTLALHAPPLSAQELARAGSMVRAIHDASEGFVPASGVLGEALIPVDGADLLCHGDLTPWNLIIGERWVFIDWDGAARSTRLWDLAYSAQAFTLNDSAEDPQAAAARLSAFVDGYRADSDLRSRLPEAMGRRTRAMLDLLETSHRTGREPWGTMFITGHGEHWRGAAEYVEQHTAVWARALTAGPAPSAGHRAG